MSVLTYTIGGLVLFALGTLAGWWIAQGISVMDDDGMDRRESERGDIYGGKK